MPAPLILHLMPATQFNCYLCGEKIEVNQESERVKRGSLILWAHSTHTSSMANVRFSEGDRVRVVLLDAKWVEADRWVLGQVGTVDCWHPQMAEWMVWIQTPGEPEPTLWMFDDTELVPA